uniref:Secreted Cholinesterase-like protein n=1 Tax=Pristhesancus plagipennis TaxID=1955184 RepID=A0A2K8JLR3_PRIPG|nr:secreted Cholinesterase-like protein [Pristhesancus plagipennis]
MSGTSLLLIVIVVIFCILWKNAKRQGDRFYGTDLLMMAGPEEQGPEGIENRTQSAGNIYAYRDSPVKQKNVPVPNPRKSTSTPASLRSSNSSLKDSVMSSPNGRPKTPPIKRIHSKRSSTDTPMTAV